MFLELHLIQNFVPANLNRDESNNPKECEFGGYRRARISSQCIKRTIRTSKIFQEHTGGQNGERIDFLLDRLKPVVKIAKPEADDVDIEAVLRAFIKIYAGDFDNKKADRTKVLVYFSQEEAETIASTLVKHWDSILDVARTMADKSKKDLKKNKELKLLLKDVVEATEDRTSAPDIAMFGRMLAETPALSLPAASQVAHAISTNKVSMDVDFFTAVVDRDTPIQSSDETNDELGAGMMGLTGFNSACFYRYARIDWDQLVKNLDDNMDLAQRAVKGFMCASLAEVPTGKQNSFAHNNAPSFALAVVRTDGMGWSLANAFEKPIWPRSNGRNASGLLEPSVEALDKYWECLREAYGDETFVRVAAFTSHPDLTLHYLKDNVITATKDENGKLIKPARTNWVETVADALMQKQEQPI